MYKKIGRFTVSYPWLVCAAWLVGGALLSVIAPSWDTNSQDDDIRFLPGRCASVRGYTLLEDSFPKEVFASKGIFAVERADGKLQPEDFQMVDRLTAELVSCARGAGAADRQHHVLQGRPDRLPPTALTGAAASSRSPWRRRFWRCRRVR